MLERAYSLLARIPKDKLLHLFTGQLGALAILLLTRPWPVGSSIACAMGATTLIACLKELSDLQDPRHKAELLDILATVAGGIPLYLLAWAVR